MTNEPTLSNLSEQLAEIENALEELGWDVDDLQFYGGRYEPLTVSVELSPAGRVDLEAAGIDG